MNNKISLLLCGFATSCLISTSCSEGRTETSNTEKRVYEERLNEVDVMVLERTIFKKEIISNGKLRASRKSDLRFKVTGEIKELKVKNGDIVKSGQTIAVLDPFEFQQRLEQAETTLKRTSIEFEDALIAHGGSMNRDEIPETIYENAAIRSGYTSALNDLKTAKFNLGHTVLRAPFSGKIANLKQNQYELATTGEVFCAVIDDSVFEVEFSLIESEIGQVKTMDSVKIVSFANTVSSSGAVSEINPLVNEDGLVLVKATVRNAGGLWEGMNVKVSIEKEAPGHLVVPKSAVVLRQNQEVLFKYTKSTAFWTYVQTGLENSTAYSVIAHPNKGAVLEAGDTVIVSNNLNLAHESKVRLKSNLVLPY